MVALSRNGTGVEKNSVVETIKSSENQSALRKSRSPEHVLKGGSGRSRPGWGGDEKTRVGITVGNLNMGIRQGK